MPKINTILTVHLSLDESLVGGDKIIWPSSFLTCHHDGVRSCHSAVLCGNHHCDAAVARCPSSSLASSEDRLGARMELDDLHESSDRSIWLVLRLVRWSSNSLDGPTHVFSGRDANSLYGKGVQISSRCRSCRWRNLLQLEAATSSCHRMTNLCSSNWAVLSRIGEVEVHQQIYTCVRSWWLAWLAFR